MKKSEYIICHLAKKAICVFYIFVKKDGGDF